MQPIKTTVIPVHPSTNVRSTQNEAWLFRVSTEYLEQLDLKRIEKKGKKGGLARRKKQLEVHNAHKEEIRFWVSSKEFIMPLGCFAIWFYVPMPASWRKKKRQQMKYTVHQNTPDLDNFLKQVFDSIMPRRNRIAGKKGADDRKIYCYASFKVWVEWQEACIKVLEYDSTDFFDEFRHGHPSWRG